jgi:hypothetical protein
MNALLQPQEGRWKAEGGKRNDPLILQPYAFRLQPFQPPSALSLPDSSFILPPSAFCKIPSGRAGHRTF